MTHRVAGLAWPAVIWAFLADGLGIARFFRRWRKSAMPGAQSRSHRQAARDANLVGRNVPRRRIAARPRHDEKYAALALNEASPRPSTAGPGQWQGLGKGRGASCEADLAGLTGTLPGRLRRCRPFEGAEWSCSYQYSVLGRLLSALVADAPGLNDRVNPCRLPAVGPGKRKPPPAAVCRSRRALPDLCHRPGFAVTRSGSSMGEMR